MCPTSNILWSMLSCIVLMLLLGYSGRIHWTFLLACAEVQNAIVPCICQLILGMICFCGEYTIVFSDILFSYCFIIHSEFWSRKNVWMNELLLHTIWKHVLHLSVIVWKVYCNIRIHTLRIEKHPFHRQYIFSIFFTPYWMRYGLCTFDLLWTCDVAMKKEKQFAVSCFMYSAVPLSYRGDSLIRDFFSICVWQHSTNTVDMNISIISSAWRCIFTSE